MLRLCVRLSYLILFIRVNSNFQTITDFFFLYTTCQQPYWAMKYTYLISTRRKPTMTMAIFVCITLEAASIQP